jgi:hypothetical protein
MKTIEELLDFAVDKIAIQTAMEVSGNLQLHITIDGERDAEFRESTPLGLDDIKLGCRIEDIKHRIFGVARMAFDEGENLTGTVCGYVEMTAHPSGLALNVTYQDRC